MIGLDRDSESIRITVVSSICCTIENALLDRCLVPTSASAGRHVVKGDLAALDQLADEEESQNRVLRARAVTSVDNDCHRCCAVAAHGHRVEIEVQRSQEVIKVDR